MKRSERHILTSWDQIDNELQPATLEDKERPAAILWHCRDTEIKQETMKECARHTATLVEKANDYFKRYKVIVLVILKDIRTLLFLYQGIAEN